MDWSDNQFLNFWSQKVSGLQLYQDDGKHANTLEWVECNGLQEIEANVNLMVQIENDLKIPSTTIKNNGRNLFF